MDSWRLIAGLGNPGAKYAGTRHNAGFRVVEELAVRWRADWSLEKQFRARLARTDVAGSRVLLCEPQTFMNASGEAVAAVMKYHRITADGLLVIVDDADLPLGEIRMRPRGGSGGHHGLEDIQRHLGGVEFARLRVGIGRRDGSREITGHVLGRFSPDEAGLVEKVLARAANQAETWLTGGIDRAMNEFNGVIEDSGNSKTTS